MSSVPPASSPEIDCAIDFDSRPGDAYNRDFRGAGRLTIRAEEPRYIFTGDERATFSSRREKSLALRSDEITNVLFDGRVVQFQTPAGESGHQRQPFVFQCADAEAAAAVAALLPATLDADFLAARAFYAKLARLPASTSLWTSVTGVLIGLNIAVFVIMGALGAGWFEVASLQPYILYGANNGAVTTDGEWWRLITCMFMHYGFIHLGMNLWALYQTGPFIERLLGRTLYALLYLGGGLCAGFASLWWNGDKIWSAGASGAIFAVYGALLGYLLREKHSLPRRVVQPILRGSMLFAVYNILFGLVYPRIDNAAHIGGFVGGVMFGWVLAMPVDQERRAGLFARRLGWGCLLLAAICAAGYAVAPRYDYHFREEKAWAETLRPLIARETSLLPRQNEFLRHAAGADYAAQAVWMERELIPLYEEWSRALAALSLDPHAATARRRDAVAKIVAQRLESYRRLATGLREKPAEALAQFHQDDALITRELAELRQ